MRMSRGFSGLYFCQGCPHKSHSARSPAGSELSPLSPGLLVTDKLHPEPHLSQGSSLFPSSAKPKITYVENKTAMELEDQITLTCEASGDPIPSITWRTSTRNISNEEKVQPCPEPPGVLGSAQLLPACPWPALACG